ncbi:5'-deoxynucleotidase HDDC2-like [Mya arenaria]|uniref:5'-deoxynucleotidase HDDC2-like n=1 Tax=Mya arenaria TaxID=6604 RepID=UPI0022E0779C|nr:5'-deoxynucleotidase HDDC2-like [Mya arenaria]
MSAQNFTKLFEFFSLIGQLKRVQRTGWVLRQVNAPESVADHMYRMSVLSLLADTSSGLNKEKCVKMSLVHDVAESIVGDIAPADCIDKVEKSRREKTAMSHITSLIPEEVGQEMMQLWMEYEDQSSAEARFVKDIDKFEMVLQAYEYEQLEEKPGHLQEFFDSTDGKFQTDTVQGWVSELRKIRGQTSPNPHFSSPHLARGRSHNTKDSATVHPFSVDHKEKDS